MITLNFALIAMMVGSNFMPMNTEIIHTPMAHPAAQVEVINKEALPTTTTVKETRTDNINNGKTYEQCMKEAFDKVYEEVNKMLDQIPEQTNEQFQLQRTM